MYNLYKKRATCDGIWSPLLYGLDRRVCPREGFAITYYSERQKGEGMQVLFEEFGEGIVFALAGGGLIGVFCLVLGRVSGMW